jgi:hypothetical protein
MPLGITKGIHEWHSQKQSVERFTDNVAYTAGHPDDTLVLAGLPRRDDVNQSATTGIESLLAIGLMQGFQMASQKPTQMMQSIGSGRGFFVSGKSTTTWRIGRLFANGRNLLRALYHSAVIGGLEVENFEDSPDRRDRTDLYWTNLDSEMYYIPFGLGAIFKDKIGDLIGSVYLELAMIQSYGIGFNAGQGMIMEDVNGFCDRVLPFLPSEVAAAPGVPRATVDAIIGFTNGDATPTMGTGLYDSNLSNMTQV